MRAAWRSAWFGGCLVSLSLAMVPASGSMAHKAEGMGPQDVAVIPIESVPSWVSDGVARSVPVEGQTGLEVLAVLRDPRDVPVDRFLYGITDDGQVIVHPQADKIRRRFEGVGHSAVAVYVRARAQATIEPDVFIDDPFYVRPQDYQATLDWEMGPWRSLGIADSTGGIWALPCLEPMTIGKGTRAFTAPDTGRQVSPDMYLPPMPQYQVKDNSGIPGMLRGAMAAGEIREGWVLCLTPDVPVEDVRVVAGWRLASGSGVYGGTPPYWAHLDEMPVGAWYRLENQQVVGWNEEPAAAPGGEPRRVDKQVVFRGDLWVSMAQAFRYRYPGTNGSGDRVSEIYAVQMSFDGMHGLLKTWDQLAVKDGVALTFCGNIGSLGCGGPQTVEVRARGTRVEGSGIGYGPHDVGTAEHKVVWVYPGNLREPLGEGKLPVWRMGFQEVKTAEISRDAACAVLRCVPDTESDRKEGVLFPLVPVGTEGLGLRVRSARFVDGEILRADGMDVFVDVGRLSAPYRWLVVEVEARGAVYGIAAINLAGRAGGAEGAEYPFSAEYLVSYGVSSGYETFGHSWDAYMRSGTSKVVLVAEVPADWRLSDIALIASYAGLGWELPR